MLLIEERRGRGRGQFAVISSGSGRRPGKRRGCLESQFFQNDGAGLRRAGIFRSRTEAGGRSGAGVAGAALDGRCKRRARTFSESASTPPGVMPMAAVPSFERTMRLCMAFHGKRTIRSGAMTALARNNCGIRCAISVTGMAGSPRPMRSLSPARSKVMGVDRSGALLERRSAGRRSQMSPIVKVTVSAASTCAVWGARRLPGAEPAAACQAGRTVRGATEIAAMGRAVLAGGGEAGWDSWGVEASGRFRQK